MKKFFLLISALVATTISASASTTTCPAGSLASYLGVGFTCTSGNLMFSNFSYSPSAGGSAVAIPAASITVTPLTVDLNEGFRFTSAWSVAGVGSFQDSSIFFTVTSIVGTTLTDLHLFFNGGVTGTGTSNVVENYCFNAPLGTCPQGQSGQIKVTNPPPAFNDAIFFQPVKSISVNKDILVSAGGNGTASISVVENTFSQIPEPATWGMLGAGLIGLGLLRRRVNR